MAVKKHEVLLKTRVFKPKELVFNEVNILGLKLVDERWDKVLVEIEENEDIELKINLLIDEAIRRHLEKEKEVFIEVEANIPGLIIRRGEGEYTGRIIVLSPRPTKIFRIGVILGEAVNSKKPKEPVLSEEKTGTMQVVVSESSVEEEQAVNTDSEQILVKEHTIDPRKATWYTVDDDIYIYEGFIITKKPWKAIIFSTEAGNRILLPGDLEARTLAVKTDRAKRTRKKRRKKKKRKTKTKKKRKTRKSKG